MDVAVRAGVATLSDTPHPPCCRAYHAARRAAPAVLSDALHPRRCPLRCWTRHARAAPAALPSATRPPHVRATPSNIERKRNS